MSVTYSEMLGWPKEKWTPVGFFAERKLICDWDDRDDLVNEMGSGHVYPYVSAAAWKAVLAVGARSEPLKGAITAVPGSSNKLGEYDKAVVTVTYATIGFSYAKVRTNSTEFVLLTEELVPAGEFITLDNESYHRRDAGNDLVELKPSEAPGKRISQMSYTLTFYNVITDTASTDWDTFVNTTCVQFANTCNSFEWVTTTLAFKFKKETLQFMLPRFSRTFQTGLLPTWTIQLRFLFNPHGWNNVWNPDRDEFAPLYDALGTTKKILVPLKDFTRFYSF